MSLKQSCFSAVLKSDLKRSWWSSALATLFMLLVTTVPLIDYVRYFTYDDRDRMFNRVMDRLATNYFVGMFLALFLGIVIFSYLNSANSVSFFHGLPMKRSTLLFAHLTSSLILLIIPVVICTLISFVAIPYGLEISWLLTGAGIYLVYSLVILSLTVFVNLLTGVSIAGGIFTLVVIFLPLFLGAFWEVLCSNYLYGFASNDEIFEWLLRYIYIIPEELMGLKVLVYIVGVAIILALCVFVYNKRHLENYGEVIAFPNLKGLFKVLFGFCAGILGYYYFMSFWSIQTIAVMFVFGFVGVIIAHMISNKSLSPKGTLKSVSVTMICIAILFAVFKFDLLGYESRIPDVDEIAYVKLSNMHIQKTEYIYNDNDSKEVFLTDVFEPKFEDEYDIQLFRKLHAKKIENRTVNGEGNHRIGMYNGFDFEYVLENGKSLRRRYYLSIDEVNEFVRPIYESDVYKKWKYPVLDETEKHYTYIKVIDKRNKHEENVASKIWLGESKEAKTIIEALIADRSNISFERVLGKHHSSYISIEVNYTVPCVDTEGNSLNAERTETYYVDAGDVNTMAVLDNLNILNGEDIMNYDNVIGMSAQLETVYMGADVLYPNDYYFEKYGVDNNGRPNVVIETAQIASSSADLKITDSTYAEGFYKYYSKADSPTESECLYDLFINYASNMPVSEKTYLSLAVQVYYDNSKVIGRQIYITADKLPEFLDDFKEASKMAVR